MRVDVVSIFPAYLDALGLSLPGRARRTGLLDLHVHDLRTGPTTVTAPSTTPPTAAAPAW